MKRLIPAIIVAAIAAILKNAFLAAAAPWSAIDPALIVIVWLVSRLRFREALAAAIVAGAIADALSSMPFGTHLVLYVATAFATDALYTRVLTNHGLLGTINIHAFAFIALHLFLIPIRLARALMLDWPLMSAFQDMRWTTMVAALGAQVGTVVLVLAIRGLAKRVFRTRNHAATGYDPYRITR